MRNFTTSRLDLDFSYRLLFFKILISVNSSTCSDFYVVFFLVTIRPHLSLIKFLKQIQSIILYLL